MSGWKAGLLAVDVRQIGPLAIPKCNVGLLGIAGCYTKLLAEFGSEVQVLLIVVQEVRLARNVVVSEIELRSDSLRLNSRPLAITSLV